MLAEIDSHSIFARDDRVGRQAGIEVVGEEHSATPLFIHQTVQLFHLLRRHVGHADGDIFLEGTGISRDGHILTRLQVDGTAVSRLCELRVGVEGVQELVVNDNFCGRRADYLCAVFPLAVIARLGGAAVTAGNGTL